MLAGATLLQCYAEIEEPAMHPHDTHWLSMDAMILLSNEAGEKCSIHCLFNYFRKDNSEVVVAGSYAVLALVCLFEHLHPVN